MTPEMVLTVAREALLVTLMLSAPLLIAALATGVLVGVLQAATQINEMTLSFIPKLVAVFVTLIVAGPWMTSLLVDYIHRLFTGIPGIIG